MNCLICKKETNRPKYCSIVCIKRGWYLRNLKGSTLGSEDFSKTNTGVGFKWETWAAKFLKAEHRKFKRGCDLVKDGKLIDVKSVKLYRRKFKRGKPIVKEQSGVWTFCRNKEKPCDFFFCIGLDESGEKIEKLLLIPNDSFPKVGCVIGKKSKYDKFVFKGFPKVSW